jgi:hypothetical protein
LFLGAFVAQLSQWVHVPDSPMAVRVMPRAWLMFLIVSFWLTTSAIFFWREYWPYLEPNAPPPYAIDLVDEARNYQPVRWNVSRSGKPILVATTNIAHNPKANDFTLTAKYEPVPNAPPDNFQNLTITRMTSSYRVDPDGKLLGVNATVDGAFQFSLTGGKSQEKIKGNAEVGGEVTNGYFAGHYEIQLNEVYHKKGNLPPVEVSSQGSVLLPLHPVNKVRNLRPRQTWRMPLVDPLGDAMAALVPGSQPATTTLFAKVLPQTVVFDWKNHGQHECYVIEYTNDDFSARTWVRVSDELVLQQEATLAGDQWILERE